MNNLVRTACFCISCCFFVFCLTISKPVFAGYNFEDLDNYLNPPEKTVSMDFQDADLATVLKMFSQQSGMNFIASSDVEKNKVNLYLNKVPVQEALERILSANGLTYEIQPGSNIFVVKSAEVPKVKLMTRVYHLKYIPLPSSKIYSTLSKIKDIAEEPAPEEDFGVVKAIEKLLTDKGSLVQDRRSNSLVVTDVPSRFPLFEQTIARLDVPVPLILIETEMLDVAKDKSDLLGAKFGSTPVTFSGAEKDSIFPFNMDNYVKDNIAPANNVPGAKDALSIFQDPRYRVSTLSFAGLQFALQFLRSQTDTRSLARPRILTLNNQTAQISIETNEAIGILDTTSGANSSSQNVVQAERTETGVFLTVTPSASVSTGEITMAIEPKVTEANSTSTFGTETFRNPETRGSKSILRVHDGDTIVIGGLLKTDKIETKTRVPVLSKVPIVGAAFRHKDNTEDERELLIFLTPQIVKDYKPKNQMYSQAEQQRPLYREQDLASQDQRNAINQEFSYLNAR